MIGETFVDSFWLLAKFYNLFAIYPFKNIKCEAYEAKGTLEYLLKNALVSILVFAYFLISMYLVGFVNYIKACTIFTFSTMDTIIACMTYFPYFIMNFFIVINFAEKKRGLERLLNMLKAKYIGVIKTSEKIKLSMNFICLYVSAFGYSVTVTLIMNYLYSSEIHLAYIVNLGFACFVLCLWINGALAIVILLVSDISTYLLNWIEDILLKVRTQLAELFL